MNALNGSLVRYLHPANHIPRKIRKDEKDFSSKPDLKDLKFAVKIGDIHKIEKKNCIGISVFGYEKKRKNSQTMCRKILSKCLKRSIY